MEPEVFGPGWGWRVDSGGGVDFVPSELVPCLGEADEADIEELREYLEHTPTETTTIEPVYGFFGRMTRPGYLDATSWTFADSEEDLLDELQGDDPKPWDIGDFDWRDDYPDQPMRCTG
jgi:hypothetical protein